MGNKINKECNEECKGYTDELILDNFDKKFRNIRSSSPNEITEEEYNQSLREQSILMNDSVDSLKNRFSNDKVKLCELLCKTRCLVERKPEKYYKRCLQKAKDLDKDLPTPSVLPMFVKDHNYMSPDLQESSRYKEPLTIIDDYKPISPFKTVKRLQKSKKTVKKVKRVKKVKSRTR